MSAYDFGAVAIKRHDLLFRHIGQQNHIPLSPAAPHSALSTSRFTVAPDFDRTNASGSCKRLVAVAAFHFANQNFEILGLAEVAVNRSETDIGDLVEAGQRLHH